LRRAEGDASKAAVLYELQHNKAGAWAKLVCEDMIIMGWRNIEALQVVVSNRARFKEKTDARAIHACAVRDLNDWERDASAQWAELRLRLRTHRQQVGLCGRIYCPYHHRTRPLR
jgi:hypothetical protein